MKKTFSVNLDVTMNGNIYIEADSIEEAEKIAKEMRFTPSDLRNFHYFSTEIFDSEEVEE